MSVEASIVVTLAEVDVADDYRIELRQHEPNVTYTWTEAEQLANELTGAVAKAREMLAEDFPVPNLERTTHGFDVDRVVDAAEGDDLKRTCRHCGTRIKSTPAAGVFEHVASVSIVGLHPAEPAEARS